MLVLKSRVHSSTPVRRERRKIVSCCPSQTEKHSYASYEDDNKYNYNYDDRRNEDVKTTTKYSVPPPTKPGSSLIILPLMRILQRNLKRTYLIV